LPPQLIEALAAAYDGCRKHEKVGLETCVEWQEQVDSSTALQHFNEIAAHFSRKKAQEPRRAKRSFQRR